MFSEERLFFRACPMSSASIQACISEVKFLKQHIACSFPLLLTVDFLHPHFPGGFQCFKSLFSLLLEH